MFRKYALYFLFWTALGLFEFSQTYTQTAGVNIHVPWQQVLGTGLGGVYLAALAVPVVLWLGRRFPFDRRYWLRRLALHLPASVVWSVAELALAAAVLPHLRVSSPPGLPAHLSISCSTAF
jgi:hypothetical protein